MQATQTFSKSNEAKTKSYSPHALQIYASENSSHSAFQQSVILQKPFPAFQTKLAIFNINLCTKGYIYVAFQIDP